MNDFNEITEYILSIPKFSGKNDFAVTKEFLSYVGDVSKKIPTIHVAGTNGKGSVCALLRAGLNANGYKVGMFISPHLVDIRERFLLDDEMISKEDFIKSFNNVLGYLENFRVNANHNDYHPSFFEMLFFMANDFFCNSNADFIILETGLGGRLDATNTIEKPVLSVITEIGLDHEEYLGNTKEKIAYEKAGIIKENIPVCFISKEAGYEHVIREAAKGKNSLVYEAFASEIKNLETRSEGLEFLFNSRYDESEFLCLPTRAIYQAENASLAFTACIALNDLGIKTNKKKFIEGFKNFKWEGRMERVCSDLYIDGGHNEDGIKAFLQTVSNDGYKHRTLLFSQVSDKDVEKVSGLILESGLFSEFYICKLQSNRAASIERFKEIFSKTDKNVLYFESVKEGFLAMRNNKKDGEMQYAAGSLYLVGEIKGLLKEDYHD